jgi:hypothetical protein
MNSPVPAQDRPEAHNASVDEALADAGGCAQIHLASGRTCTLRRGHEGSCHFVPRGEL